MEVVETLPSVKTQRSAKITVVSFIRLLTALCWALSFAEYLELGKDFSVPRVLLSVNAVVTESSTLLSAALDKDIFAECRIKSTR
jgi:hypothetical protein